MGPYSYTTIAGPAEGSYREKGSKFLAFAYPVTTEEEIRNALAGLQKKYFDARHHCFAWMLGPARNSFRAFDDGEPNHSAGDPILGQIRSRNLTDVLVVVVRYFGGVKLGVGGLIAAYKAAADDALSHAQIVEREVRFMAKIEFPYESTPGVMKLVKEFGLTIAHQEFGERCAMEVSVPERERMPLSERVTLLQSTGTPMEFRAI